MGDRQEPSGSPAFPTREQGREPAGRLWARLGAHIGSPLLKLWLRITPTPWPYSWRILLAYPLPNLTRRRLRQVLTPRAGERLLEVGPGTGYHALDVAKQLLPDGTLEIIDVQQEMLDHVMARASKMGITNIRPERGDARKLPYPTDSFDGAYLITVLGETGDANETLSELSRVIKPGGKLIVGEFLFNPRVVTFRALQDQAQRMGLRYDGRVGTPLLSYLARFVKDDVSPHK
jgi:ubiquinone/menaquinone biosynthesis C-methylase UbiE